MPLACNTVTHITNNNPLRPSQDLENYFSKCGRVLVTRIVREPSNGHSRGFGFVGFDHADDVGEVGIAACLTVFDWSCWFFTVCMCLCALTTLTMPVR